MGDDSLILVTATIDGARFVLKTFTGTQDRKALAYANREADSGGIDISVRAYVAPTQRPSLDETCPN